MPPLLICIQMHRGDQKAAMALARLIADLEPAKSREADILFSHAIDCIPDWNTIREVGRKFNVKTFISDRRDIGWPAGPNSQFFSTYDRFYAGTKKEGWPYQVALFLEPDCTPTRPGWISEVLAEWSKGDQLVLGFLYTKMMHPIPHINGAACFAPLFRKKVPEFFSCDNRMGWDCAFSRQLLHYGRASELFWVDYQVKHIDEESLYAVRSYPLDHPLHGKEIHPAIHHGCKSEDARDIVRRRHGLNG